MFVHDNKASAIVGHVRGVLVELLKVSIITYILLYLIEFVSPGFVTLFFEIHTVAFFAVIVGVVYIALGGNMDESEFRIGKQRTNLIYVTLVAASVSVVLFLLLQKYGTISILISIFSFIIVFSIIQLINKQDN